MRIGIDTGGTFTDFVLVRDGKLEVFKRFSTPRKPEAAILEGLRDLNPEEVIHGSTVATNALLERKGARVALLTTEGFEDVLAIGRQTRRELYNIFVQRPEPLVPSELRFGVKERTLHDGTVERSPEPAHLKRLVATLRGQKIEAAAICLLFSFANAQHEDLVAEALASLNIPLSLSSRVLPEYREYERTSTTVINAYLAPLMGEYLNRLSAGLTNSRLRVMQSNGGAVRAQTTAELPVHTIVSGPAGGVVGAFHVAEACGYPNIITFDMGGTSTDVSLCEGRIGVTHEAEIDGLPVGIPIIDIHTVGAGGGSIAQLDAGGALQVGPASAGADPGPICYGKGGESLTVTDANVLLGRLPPRFFLGGTVPLASDRIAPVLSRLSWIKAWASLEELAQGVIDVVNNNMEHAIRLISVERGHDPRDFSLVCFGGAGGLHAAELARALGIPRVVVPQHPGALSALGLLQSDVRKDYSRSMLIDAAGADEGIRAALDSLHRLGLNDMRVEGFEEESVQSLDSVDLRYRGQSYELNVSFTPDFVSSFHQLHERRYGHSDSNRAVELVNVRATMVGRTSKIEMLQMKKTRTAARSIEVINTWFSGQQQKTAVYDRTTLLHGHKFDGPAIVGEYSATTLVPADFRCEVDAFGNLLLGRS